MTDLMERLRAADPVAEALAPRRSSGCSRALDAADAAPPAAAWDVGDVPAAPARSPHPPRARRPSSSAARRPLLAGLAAATALDAVAVLAGTWSSPDVVAEASEALGSQGAIVHTVTVDRRPGRETVTPPAGQIVPGRAQARGRHSAIQYERWYAQDPVRERARMTVESEEGGTPGIQDTAVRRRRLQLEGLLDRRQGAVASAYRRAAARRPSRRTRRRRARTRSPASASCSPTRTSRARARSRSTAAAR